MVCVCVCVWCPVMGAMVIDYDKGGFFHKAESGRKSESSFAICLLVKANGEDLDKGIWWSSRVKGQVQQETRSY